MLCKTCGKQIDDGTAFCPFCKAEAVSDETAPAQPAPDIKTKKPLNKKFIAAVCAAAVVILAAIVAICLFAFPSPERVAAGYEKAITESDIGRVNSFCAYNCRKSLIDSLDNSFGLNYVLDMYSKKYDTEIKNEKDLWKIINEKTVGELKEEYGDDYKIAVTVTNKKNLDNSDLDVLINNAKNSFRSGHYIDNLIDQPSDNYHTDGLDINDYIKIKKINAGMTVTCRVSITGSKNADTGEIEINLVKIGAQWKVLEF